MEYLTKLFGSSARVKLLRLFLFNPERVYDRDSIASATRVATETVAKELVGLARTGILKRKSFTKIVPGVGKIAKKRKTIGWTLDQKYPYKVELSRFLHETLSISDVDIRNRFRGVGTVHLLVVAGFLIDKIESPLEILLVGNKLDNAGIATSVRDFESECGRDIRYAVLSVEEYLFRKRVRDKLVRDLFDFPHHILIDRISE